MAIFASYWEGWKKVSSFLSIDEVLQSLQEGLKSYIGWYRKRNGSVKLEQLKKWADAVVNKCRLNVDKVMLGTSLKPDGYSGLVAQLTEAKGLLTFVLDDRGPQIVHACCTKWYQRNLRKIIADARTYEKCTETWDSILQVMKERLMKYGFGSLEGRPYLYGIFKAKKRRWRPIVGITSRGDESTAGVRPRQPMQELHQLLTRILQAVMTSLKAIDMERIVMQSKRAYWIKESPQEIAAWIRQNLSTLAGRSMKIIDFKDMYTNIDHKLLLQRVETAVDEALRWEHLNRSVREREELGWNIATGDYEMKSSEEEASTILLKEDVMQLLATTLDHCYITNGGECRRQIRGILMGISPSPQLANLYCYSVERDFVLRADSSSWLNCRYLDDLFVIDPIPSEEEYGMSYATSSEGNDVVYVGIRIYVKDGLTRTTLYDREEEYPFHILRYPSTGSVSSTAQLGGVLMGRFVAAQQFCSTMADFKQSVAWILRRAHERGYTFTITQRMWTKFLFTKWQTKDIRTRELRAWFPKAWAWAASANKATTSSELPWKHPRNEEESLSLSLFGKNKPTTGALVATENLQQISHELLQRWIATLSTLELVPCELYQLKRARGDGNCMFYSLLQLNNSVAANELREEMAAWIEKNSGVVVGGQTVQAWIEQQHIPRRRSPVQYAQALRSGLWGGSLEIMVFTQLYSVIVELYILEGDENYRQVQVTKSLKLPIEKTVRLLYSRDHYDWLEPCESRVLEEARLLQAISCLEQNPPNVDKQQSIDRPSQQFSAAPPTQSHGGHAEQVSEAPQTLGCEERSLDSANEAFHTPLSHSQHPHVNMPRKRRSQRTASVNRISPKVGQKRGRSFFTGRIPIAN